MSRFFAIAAFISLAGAMPASAGINTLAYLQEVDNTSADAEVPGFSSMYDTWDLMIVVDAGDDWHSTYAFAETTGFYFYDYPNFVGDVPVPGLWSVFPASEYDSYYMNPEGLIAPLFFAQGPITFENHKEAEWYDDPPNGGAGVYAIARYTIPEGEYLYVDGWHTSVNSGGDIIPFHVDNSVPAPGSLLLLSMGSLAIRRRR